MFGQNKGTIDSKKNIRLRELIRKRRKEKIRVVQDEKQKEELLDKKKKDDLIISNHVSKKNTNDKLPDNYISKRIIKKGKKKQEEIKAITISPEPVLDEVKENVIIPNSYDESDIKIEKTNKDIEPNPIEKSVGNKDDSTKNIIQPTETIKYDEPSEENLLELALTNEFEVILKEHQYDLNKLVIDFNTLNDNIDEVVETDELEKMSDEIEDLVKKLEIIKKELELLTNSATFKNIYKLHDPYLTNLIDEYRNNITENKELLDTVTNLENNSLYISIVNKIIEFESEKEKFNNKLDNLYEEYEIRDENFEKWKNRYTDVESITKSLDELVKISDRKLKEIEEKVSKSVNVTEIVETKMKSSLGIIAKTILIMSLLKKNPTRQANGLTAITTLTAISLVNDLIKPKKVTTKRFETDLVDYRNMIDNTINDIHNINILISKNISEVQNLKELFEKEFKEYQYDIPEYKDFFDKLNSIEKEMYDRQNNMNKISHDLNYQYDKNNAKVKKYEHLS